METRTIGIGIVGCGVVGTGVLEILARHGGLLDERLGAPIEVRHVVVGDASKRRAAFVPLDRIRTDVEPVLTDPSVDVVVELMGGTTSAYDVVRRALEQGKHVVTANKALLAERGEELFALADARDLDVYFEAAVAGGIPIIRVLREGFASDRIRSVRGIVNGTSNYILSRMRSAGLDFAVALREAQQKGYAEADPTLDVGGGDASHKLAILARLAFGKHVRIEHVTTEGIEGVGAVDMEFARRFGYVVKPLGVARELPDGRMDLRVHPALVREDTPLANANGALNAIEVVGEHVGPAFLSGLGAGAGPTAVSVVGDVLDVGRNILANANARVSTPTRAVDGPLEVQPMGELVREFYLRLTVKDRPGVLARVTSALAKEGVSIAQMVQQRPAADEPDAPTTIVFLTHEAREASIRAAVAEIDRHDDMASPTRLLRIED